MPASWRACKAVDSGRLATVNWKRLGRLPTRASAAGYRCAPAAARAVPTATASAKAASRSARRCAVVRAARSVRRAVRTIPGAPRAARARRRIVARRLPARRRRLVPSSSSVRRVLAHPRAARATGTVAAAPIASTASARWCSVFAWSPNNDARPPPNRFSRCRFAGPWGHPLRRVMGPGNVSSNRSRECLKTGSASTVRDRGFEQPGV